MAGLLAGKISLVTGAASGIGRATSLVMSREGAIVAVSDVNADGAEETLSAIKEAGGDGMFFHAHVPARRLARRRPPRRRDVEGGER